MFVYVESERHVLWTVGHYDPQGEWVPERDCDSAEEAADRTAWLNGSVCRFEDRIELVESLKRLIGSARVE